MGGVYIDQEVNNVFLRVMGKILTKEIPVVILRKKFPDSFFLAIDLPD